MILTKYVMYRGSKKKVSDLSPNNRYKVKVICPVCREVREVYHKSILKAGHTMCHSCSINKKLRKHIEVGTKFNRLKVVGSSDRNGFSICECQCGNVKEISNSSLINGTTKSCGCLRSDNMAENGYRPKDEEHWNWKGGKTNERKIAMSRKDYKDWRSSVFERDNYTCVGCGQVGYELNAHHIESYSENEDLRMDIDNGITLCEKCHIELHSIYGNKTTNDDLIEWLEKK